MCDLRVKLRPCQVAWRALPHQKHIKDMASTVVRDNAKDSDEVVVKWADGQQWAVPGLTYADVADDSVTERSAGSSLLWEGKHFEDNRQCNSRPATTS